MSMSCAHLGFPVVSEYQYRDPGPNPSWNPPTPLRLFRPMVPRGLMDFAGGSDLPGNISQHGTLLHEPVPSFILALILVLAFVLAGVGSWMLCCGSTLPHPMCMDGASSLGSTVGHNREFPYSPSFCWHREGPEVKQTAVHPEKWHR